MTAPVRGILFDLDGVFYVGDKLIPGAVAVLEQLQQRRIPFAFITNTTTSSAASLCNKLTGLGLPVTQGQLVTAPVATCNYLRSQGLQRCYFAVKPEVMADFAGITRCEDHPQAVVIGDIGDAWSYSLLDTLFQKLVGGARLVAMHKNRYWQKAGGLHVDIGAFVAGLEYVASTEAVITGKPSADFFEAALNVIGCHKSEVVVVGDDVISDVGGAQQAGLRGALVKTGKYRDALVADCGVVPDWTFISVAELVSGLGDNLQSAPV